MGTTVQLHHAAQLHQVISFSWVAALSWVIVTSISQLAIGIHLSHAVMGVTVVAFGAEVPDTISSVAAAKAGEGSMALANCMGSQITNILVGLGLPYLISNLCGRLVKIPTGHVTILVNSLAFIVLSMITEQRAPKHPKLFDDLVASHTTLHNIILIIR